MKSHTQVLCLFLLCTNFLFIDDARADDKEVIPVVVQQEQKTETDLNKKIHLSARMDLGLSRGVSVNEGFKVPGLRLSASGTVTNYLSYRISAGQTKEFSSILLPQLLPVEAFITLEPDVPEDFAKFKWKIGLMSPTLNPWFSPDLGELRIPDYLESHRALLLSRDLGSEIILLPWSERLELAFGVFNGNGVLGANSNGSLSATGMARLKFPVGEGNISIGGSGLILRQGALGGNNYRSQAVANGFASWENSIWSLGIEGWLGYYEDDIRKLNPVGGATFLDFKLVDHLRFFGRWEYLMDGPPVGKSIRRIQTGPMWAQGDFLWLFFYYQWFDEGNGVGDSSGELRIRLNI